MSNKNSEKWMCACCGNLFPMGLFWAIASADEAATVEEHIRATKIGICITCVVFRGATPVRPVKNLFEGIDRIMQNMKGDR